MDEELDDSGPTIIESEMTSEEKMKALRAVLGMWKDREDSEN